MVFKLTDLLEITKAAMEMCDNFGFTNKQILDLDIELEPVHPDGTAHFSLRKRHPVIPEYHMN